MINKNEIDKYINNLNNFNNNNQRFISVYELQKQFNIRVIVVKGYIFAGFIKSIVHNKQLSIWTSDIPLVLALYKLSAKCNINFKGLKFILYAIKDKNELLNLVEQYMSEKENQCLEELK